MDTPLQESRTERVGIAVTPSEKRALELVANVRNVDGLSNLLRIMSVAEAVAEGQRLLARLREEVGKPSARGAA